eukprot:TRINITY_DN1328_c0_g1_i15.p2 TRINITY_DN1328_c0_g1~~TRINITY_DN1328_c0_g1_i15.p2  ORF type:complete len:104 (-),score=13.55 TRINITY_DN1328_c0_g1_i15:86-397(-)
MPVSCSMTMQASTTSGATTTCKPMASTSCASRPTPLILQPIQGVCSELKKHVRALIYDDRLYIDKTFHLMAAAVGMLTSSQVAGQFARVSHELAKLLAPVPEE